MGSVTAPAVTQNPFELPDLNAPMSDAQIDAIASDVCRQLADIHKEQSRYIDAQAAEIERIRFRYSQLMKPLDERYKQLVNYGEELASRADFGKKKSRNVGFGSYGRRTVAQAVRVVDEDAAIKWASEKAPEIVTSRTIRTIDKLAAKKVVLEMLTTDGVIPPGFDHEPPRESYFIKPIEESASESV